MIGCLSKIFAGFSWAKEIGGVEGREGLVVLVLGMEMEMEMEMLHTVGVWWCGCGDCDILSSYTLPMLNSDRMVASSLQLYLLCMPQIPYLSNVGISLPQPLRTSRVRWNEVRKKPS